MAAAGSTTSPKPVMVARGYEVVASLGGRVVPANEGLRLCSGHTWIVM